MIYVLVETTITKFTSEEDINCFVNDINAYTNTGQQNVV